MHQSSNQAKKLYEIFEETTKLPKDRTLKENWATIFQIQSDTDSTYHIAEALHRLSKIIDKVEDSINKYDDLDHELHLKYFPNIKSAATITHFDQKWSDVVTNQITDIVLLSLRVCAQTLRLKGENYKLISPKDLNEIQEEVLLLFDKISRSNLSEDLEDLLVNALEDISRAIHFYGLDSGIKLKRAYETNFALISMYAQQMEKASLVDKRNQEIFSGIAHLFQKLSVHISASIGTALGTVVVEKLLSGSGLSSTSTSTGTTTTTSASASTSTSASASYKDSVSK